MPSEHSEMTERALDHAADLRARLRQEEKRAANLVVKLEQTSIRLGALSEAACEFCSRVEEGAIHSIYSYARFKNALGAGREKYNIKAREVLAEKGRGAVSKCRSCGKMIVWVKTERGLNMPCDLDGRPHWATCPYADKHRREDGRG